MWFVGWEGFKAEPMGADAHCVAGLFGGIEELFDAALVARVLPAIDQVADGVDTHHLLQREGDLRLENAGQGNVGKLVGGKHRFSRDYSLAGDSQLKPAGDSGFLDS